MKNLRVIASGLNLAYAEMLCEYDDIRKRLVYSKVGAYSCLVQNRRSYIPESGEYDPAIPLHAVEVR